MGIFDFLKNAGEDDKGRKDLDDEQMRELKIGNTVARKIQGSGITISGMDVHFDDGTVTLKGSVVDQTAREKAVLIAGNTPGVARVDDRLDVGGAGNASFGGNLYTVQKGDTLSEIAKARYGDAGRWKEIFEANTPMLKDPDTIYPGQVLRLPQ